MDGTTQLPDGPVERRVSRTGLLKLGAAAAFVFGVGPAARAVAADDAPAKGVAVDLRTRVRGPRHLRLATYVPLVGSAFRIHQEEASSLKVTLVSATRLPAAGESFSLVFRGAADAAVGQQTYTLEHPRLGRFPLFIVPVGPATKTQDFQAIVNRISGAPRV